MLYGQPSCSPYWLMHLPLPAVYAVVALGAVVAAPFRPAVSALVPQVLKQPQELTAANAALGAMEPIGMA